MGQQYNVGYKGEKATIIDLVGIAHICSTGTDETNQPIVIVLCITLIAFIYLCIWIYIHTIWIPVVVMLLGLGDRWWGLQWVSGVKCCSMHIVCMPLLVVIVPIGMEWWVVWGACCADDCCTYLNWEMVDGVGCCGAHLACIPCWSSLCLLGLGNCHGPWWVLSVECWELQHACCLHAIASGCCAIGMGWQVVGDRHGHYSMHLACMPC